MAGRQSRKKSDMKNSIKRQGVGLGAAALAAVCYLQPAVAGYKSALSPAGIGKVEASLAYTTTNKAVTPEGFTRPSAGVTQLGTWTAKVPQPPGTPLVCTSTVSTVFMTGGYKAVARSWVTTGVTADNPELKKKLADEKFELIPGVCGAGYEIASGEEIIDGKRHLVVLGKATAGVAVWFRGFVYDGTPGAPLTTDAIIQNGIKVYDLVLKGPFDFGDIESSDRCKAMKVPIEYDGPNLYFVSDALAESITDLQFVNPPDSVTFDCSDRQLYPVLKVRGGCGPVKVTFSPSLERLPLGESVVTATATDQAGNTATHQFTVKRPYLEFCGFYPPIDGTGGTCAEPLKRIKAGSRVPIKFDTTICGVPYPMAAPPTVTITKLDPATCEVISIPVDHKYFQWVANRWHFNWRTLDTDKGLYRIEADLGDGGENPYAIVELGRDDDGDDDSKD